MSRKIIIITVSTTILLFFILKLVDKPKVYGREFKKLYPFLDPIQVNTTASSIQKKVGNAIITIIPAAEYNITAKIVSKATYFPLDWSGKIAPYDLALAWGNLTTPNALKEIRYSQFNRWYFYKYPLNSVYGADYISSHSANTHIIHSNDNILKAIKFAKKGDLINLSGYLVNIEGTLNGGNISWNTSLTRTDTGDGSCEVFYVTQVRLGNNVYK